MIDRYHRQTLLPQIKKAGQEKLTAATVLIVGCGALGSHLASMLARAGVGNLVLADRDIVELTNLQRQVLFDEADAVAGKPKAIAAAERLAKINSTIRVMPKVVDVSSRNLESLASGVNLILDGTDNVATRYLLNDFCVRANRPWVYSACVGVVGRSMLIQPSAGPCLRCVFEPPAADEVETCDTAGVLGTAASITAGISATRAIHFLVGGFAPAELAAIDVWNARTTTLPMHDAKRPDCPTCGLRRFDFWNAKTDGEARLCGRAAVQVQLASIPPRSLTWIADRLASGGTVQRLPYMIRCKLHEGGLSFSAFEDGRVLVQGTADIGRARSAVQRYLGS